MAAATSGRLRSRWGSRWGLWASFMEPSEVVLEGSLRFGFTLALPASFGPDGAAAVRRRSFSGGTLVWIDVESTDALGSWLDDGGEGLVIRIWFGPFLASGSLVIIGGGSGLLFWSFCDLVMVARSATWFGKATMPRPGGAIMDLLLVAWLLPLQISFHDACFGVSDSMAIRSTGFIYLSLLHFQICCFHYGDYLGFGCHGRTFSYFVVVATKQLVVVLWADDGGPTMVLLLFNDSGQEGWRALGSPRHSVLSAQCNFYYYFLIVLICYCFLFPYCPYSGETRLNGVNHYCGCQILCVLFLIQRWRTTIKWLLPPSVRMKHKVFNFFNGFGWLHEEVELLTGLLCLCVGNFSSMDSCYFKTIRVAFVALVVVRESVYSCMAFNAVRRLSLLLRVFSGLIVVIVHEVRFYAPLVVHLC